MRARSSQTTLFVAALVTSIAALGATAVAAEDRAVCHYNHYPYDFDIQQLSLYCWCKDN